MIDKESEAMIVREGGEGFGMSVYDGTIAVISAELLHAVHAVQRGQYKYIQHSTVSMAQSVQYSKDQWDSPREVQYKALVLSVWLLTGC